MITRTLTKTLLTYLKPGHVLALFGARRTGKTVIMQTIIKTLDEEKVLMLNGEDMDVASVLSSQRQETLTNLVAGFEYLFIDEAQNIPNIGASLKLLVDTQPDVSVFVTGSASFALRNQIGEPLTGRSTFFYLYPFSISEVINGLLPAMQQLPAGMYPQVYLAENLNEKLRLLESIKNGYLLKDVLQLDNLKDSLFIFNLLRYIALQIGNDISYSQLASNLNTTVKTVQRYLDILEKAFIIFRLQAFSRNLRKEISKSTRFIFWDNGIRNAIISNFSPAENRDDMGKLCENFCISERMKKQSYAETFSSFYFWRTYDQQEIDLIEETNQKITAFGFKWGDKIAKAPRAFSEGYPDATSKPSTE
ncbi:MAG: ATP-binding protein [Bacteroidales bacterium]|nr:ATP-binding protein [Bacteroidales bacterium]